MSANPDLKSGSYCKVFVNHKHGMLSSMGLPIFQSGWIEGIIVSVNARRARIDIGRKEIVKRLRFIKPV